MEVIPFTVLRIYDHGTQWRQSASVPLLDRHSKTSVIPVFYVENQLDSTTIHSQMGRAGRTPPFTMVLNHSAELHQTIRPPSDRNLALEYMFADFDNEGDEAAALALSERHWYVWPFWYTLFAAYKLSRL